MNLQAIKSSVMKFIKDEEGLTIVEYAVAGGDYNSWCGYCFWVAC